VLFSVEKLVDLGKQIIVFIVREMELTLFKE
jgi:hypothetical protein